VEDIAGIVSATMITKRSSSRDRYTRKSVPVAQRPGIVRSHRFTAVVEKVIVALKTAERPGLAMLDAQVESRNTRIGRRRALAGGRMGRIGIVEIVISVASRPKHLLTERPRGGSRRPNCGRCNHRNRSEPKPDKSNHENPHVAPKHCLKAKGTTHVGSSRQ
jgi:hypothetical protein